MIPDGFQYLLEHVWNFQKCDQRWPHRTPYLLKKYFKRYKKSMETFYKNIMIVNLGIWTCEMFWKPAYWYFWKRDSKIKHTNKNQNKCACWMKSKQMWSDVSYFEPLQKQIWFVDTYLIWTSHIIKKKFSFWKPTYPQKEIKEHR